MWFDEFDPQIVKFEHEVLGLSHYIPHEIIAPTIG